MSTVPLRAGAVVVRLLMLSLSVAAATAQSGPSRVLGRAVDRDGRPMAGVAVGFAEVRGFVDTAALLASPVARTGDDGAFCVSMPEGTPRGVVLARPGCQGLACLGLWGARPTAGGDANVGDLPMLAGVDLSGRVRDESGKPVAGARVHVESPLPSTSGLPVSYGVAAGALTADDGIFAIQGVSRTGLRVTVTAPGRRAWTQLCSWRTPLDVVLPWVGLVRGRVVDEQGRAIAGIRVNGAAVAADAAPELAPVTDANGAFALTVPAGWRFRVSGAEEQPPYRTFGEKALRAGPVDDVVLTPTAPSTSPPVRVRVVDGATRAEITSFRASAIGFLTPGQIRAAWLLHLQQRQQCSGEARLPLAPVVGSTGAGVVVVDAAGHGWRVVAIPADRSGVIEVELGPEACVAGVVIDATTRRPMAGVAVRVLPAPADAFEQGFGAGCVMTDAEGRYRATGLRPGTYVVDALAADRPVSKSRTVDAAAGETAEADLLVRAGRAGTVLTLRGEVPKGPARQLVFHLDPRSVAGRTLSVTLPPPRPLTGPGPVEVSPFGECDLIASVWLPSRVLVGAGTRIPIGILGAGKREVVLDLPQLDVAVVRGRVVLPRDVPSERVAVLVRIAGEPSSPFDPAGADPGHQLAPLAEDGSFELDVPAGDYSLQLVDLATGICFHTEPRDVAVGGDAESIELRPEIHRLDLRLVAAVADAPVVVQRLSIAVPRLRSSCRALLQPEYTSPEEDRGWFPVAAAGAGPLLVPAGTIAIAAHRASLGPQRDGDRAGMWEEVARGRVVVDAGRHALTLTVPAPPTDEELERAR